MVIWLWLTASLIVAVVAPRHQQSGEKAVIDKILKGYTRQDPPLLEAPTEVQLGLLVNSFYSVSEQTMDYSINFYLRQQWRDERLQYPPRPGVKNKIKLEGNMWSKIWIPDTFFRNEKKAAFHDITVFNRLLTLNSTGWLWYVTKISATLACPMTLQKYPMDTQICPLMFESFGYTMDTMYFSWLPGDPVDFANIEMPQFTLQKWELKDCSQSYTAGNFTCQEVKFFLRRDIGFFLIQVYVPSVLIVILSWVSFWINMESSPARVSIGLLTVLTTSTMSGNARATLPRVSYIKAIDIWMIVCLVFVFSSLIEYAFVNVLSRGRSGQRRAPAPASAQSPGGAAAATTSSAGAPTSAVRQPSHGDKDGSCSVCIWLTNMRRRKQSGPVDPDVGKRQARRIDQVSRRVFPLAFVLFNVVYWTVYIVMPDPSAGE